MAAEATARTAGGDPVAAPVFHMRRFRPQAVEAAIDDGPDAAPLHAWVEDIWTGLPAAAPPAAVAAASDGAGASGSDGDGAGGRNGAASAEASAASAAAAPHVRFQVSKSSRRCKVPTVRPDEGADEDPAEDVVDDQTGD